MLIVPAQQVHFRPPQAVLSDLREKVGRLDGTSRRLARTVTICDFIDNALPARGLPLGCIHEVKGNPASVIAFSALLSARIGGQGAIFYIAPDRNFSPLGLLPYSVRLEQWVHVCARRPQDLIWTVLETLRCPQVNAVIAALPQADLTTCRRLQLAAESSGATGFLIGNSLSSNIASAITRWRVAPLRGFSGQAFDHPAWRIDLTYFRGGRPDNWKVICRNGYIERFGSSEAVALPVQRKALAG